MATRSVLTCLAFLLLQGNLSGQTDSAARGFGAGPDSLKRGPRAALRILSEPGSARVFTNGTFVGLTPLSYDREPSDSLHILVSSDSYRPWETTVQLKAGDTLGITALPQRLDALLSIAGSDSNAGIFIDGRFAARGSVTGYALPPGGHQLMVRDSSGVRCVTRYIKVKEGENQDFSAELGHRSIVRLLGSVVLPGYSQCADGAYLKGAGLFVGTVAAVLFTINSAGDYTDRREQYDAAVGSYSAARTEQDAVIRHDIVVQRHDDLKSARRLRNVSLGVLGAVFVLNLTDTILNHLMADDILLIPGRVGVRLDADPGRQSLALRTEFILH